MPEPTALRRLPRAALALVAVAATLPQALHMERSEALPQLPVLWEGRVVNPDGEPAAGAQVSLFARPPARDIRPGDEMRHVATTVAGPTGHFIVAARPPSVDGLTDPAGWVTMMATARSAEGISMAVDSVAWQETGAAGGRWVTSPATAFSTDPATLSRPELPEVVANERPATLRLAKGPDEAPDVPRGPGPKGHPRCVAAYKSKWEGPREVVVGDLHRDKRWAGNFIYTDTRSTSFQTGWSQDGKRWGLAGSVSFGDTESGEERTESSGEMMPALDRVIYQEFLATMEFARFTWRCGEPDWYDVDTVEPFDWTGSVRGPEQGAPASCDGRHMTWVDPQRDFIRRSGASQTNVSALKILGFTGSTTTAGSTAATQVWRNQADHGRQLCGDRDFPKQGHTRVVSLP